MFCLLLLQVALVAPPQFIRSAALPEGCHATFSTMGFSENEEAMALKRMVSCERGEGAHDVYSLIDLIDLEKGEVRATFAGASPRRLTPKGHLIFTPPAQLRQANAPFAHAQSHAAWEHLARLGHFFHITHDFEDQMVRFDFDQQLGEVEIQHEVAHVSVKNGQPLHFSVLARLASGKDVVIANMASSDDSAEVVHSEANVSVHYSHFGHAVCVLVHSGHHTHVYTALIPQDDSIGSIKMGGNQILQASPDELEHDFLSSHPYAKKNWRHFIRGTM